jgi:hypothetical protein
MMRIFITALSLIALLSACSDNENLENTGREAGAAADQAIERVGNKVDDGRADIHNSAAQVREKTREVKENIRAELSKADNAVDAAADELKK